MTRFIKNILCPAALSVGVFLSSQAQVKISGSVTAAGGEAIPGASVYLVNTLDGASSDAAGNFFFLTTESGERTLAVSAIGFLAQQKIIVIAGQPVHVSLQLEEAAAQLNEVVISAGSLEANSDREVAVLKPMDIYTNAGAAGDIVGAIQTLPGTQRVAEQTGLFVRGGDASESAVIIDGMVVQNAFFSNVPGVAQRSRFTPFQFKGMAFSSGGYSVRYGQALSSILELNTLDLPEKTTLSVNVNMSGITLSAIKRWRQSAAEATGYYTNLTPFYKLANTNFDFYDVPAGGGASAKWSTQNKRGGIFKALARHDFYQSGTAIPDPYQPGNTVRFGMQNRNTYVNASFRELSNKMLYYTALSLSSNEDNTRWGAFPNDNTDWRAQARAEATYFMTDALNVTLGSEIQRYQFRQDTDTATCRFDEALLAGYLETEWKPVRSFALKPGVRAEYSALLRQGNLAPRVAMALMTGNHSQVSLAGGLFYQLADKRYLLRGYALDFQQAVHYMANYQWLSDSRSFRIEGYYKSYQQLVREPGAAYNANSYRAISGVVDNSGNGYARGLDLFWRDQKTIANFDYWLAYSYVDTKRLYANLADKVMPDFVSAHNVNITVKYFVESLQVNVGATYALNSGRPYFDPADSRFLGARSPAYHNLSLNASYLTSIGKWFAVFYINADNVLNRKNVLGYRYAADGQTRYAIQPPLYRAVFVGVNISLTSFKKEEL